MPTNTATAGVTLVEAPEPAGATGIVKTYHASLRLTYGQDPMGLHCGSSAEECLELAVLAVRSGQKSHV